MDIKNHIKHVFSLCIPEPGSTAMHKKMRQSMPHFCVTGQISAALEAEITLAGFYLFDAFGSDASHLFIGYIGEF